MAISFDPSKRDWTLEQRGLAFEDAERVFAGPTYTFADDRQDYGEERRITFGFLANRLVVVCWTPRGNDQHVFSMRKANLREQKSYIPILNG